MKWKNLAFEAPWGDASRLMNPPHCNPWSVLGSRKIYHNPWIDVVEHRVINPAGKPGIYGVVGFRHTAVAVVPVDTEGMTWLVGQYRFPLGAYSWEVPEGGAAADESAEDCAHRELAEETGLHADRLTRILEMDLSNCVTDERSVSFVATDLTHGRPSPEETERLALRRLPLEEAIAMAGRGEIRDALSVATLLRLHVMLRSGGLRELFPGM